MGTFSVLDFWVGSACASAGVLLLLWRVVFVARGIRVTGEVIEWVEDPMHGGDCDLSGATYQRKIAYRDHTGTLHHAMSWARFSPFPFGGLAVGVPIGVYFMPEMPAWPLLDTPGELWLPPIALLAAGGTMLGWGRLIGL